MFCMSRIGTILVKIAIFSTLVFQGSLLHAQQYVDAPLELDGQLPLDDEISTEQSFASVNNKDVNNQLSTGIFNYSLLDPIYKQFTGDPDFDDSGIPLSMFVSGRLPYVDEDSPYAGLPSPCVTWVQMDKTGFEIPSSWAYGLEFLSFSATSETSYTGDNSASVPDVNMSLYMLTLKIRIFFLDAFDEAIQPYFETGWGTIFGTFTSKIDGEDKKTNFYGLQTSNTLGTNVTMSPEWGFFFEIRTITGDADTSNDPFNQGDGKSVKLNINGSITTASIYYRY